jgi:hypothetical protein
MANLGNMKDVSGLGRKGDIDLKAEISLKTKH